MLFYLSFQGRRSIYSLNPIHQQARLARHLSRHLHSLLETLLRHLDLAQPSRVLHSFSLHRQKFHRGRCRLGCRRMQGRHNWALLSTLQSNHDTLFSVKGLPNEGQLTISLKRDSIGLRIIAHLICRSETTGSILSTILGMLVKLYMV